MPTPKSRLHAYFQSKKQQPTYSTTAMQEQAERGSGPQIPGLVAIRTVFVSTVTLPDSTKYTSEAFPRKRDAEQDAARIAMEKIGLLSSELLEKKLETDEEKWEALSHRIVASFADQCVLSYRPLMEHFRASIRKKADGTGGVSAAVLAAYNTKVFGTCKAIDPLSESDPVHAVELVLKAVEGCKELCLNRNDLCISRKEPFGHNVQQELLAATEGQMRMHLDVVYIPSSLDRMITSLDVEMGAHQYYLDAFAQHLQCRHAGHVLISRIVGKTPAGNAIRLYWPITPSSMISDLNPTNSHVFPNTILEDGSSLGGEEEAKSGHTAGLSIHGTWTQQNIRATILTGYTVYGNAILASAGSDWRSEGQLICDNVDLVQYHRLILMKSPRGSYKLSRNAVLAAELPTTYTTRNQWRGSLPRAILTEFCQHHHLPEPSFVLSALGCKNAGLAIEEKAVHANGSKPALDNGPKQLSCDDDTNNEKDTLGPFESSVTVQWRDGTLIRCLSENAFRSQVDAKQSASMKALLQVISLFDSHLAALGHDHPFRVMSKKLYGLTCCPESGMLLGVEKKGTSVTGIKIIDGNDFSGKFPVHGCMVCVDYEVHVEPNLWDHSQHLCSSEQFLAVESNSNFEFELGKNAVVPQLEYCVATMSVGQTARFFTPPPPRGLLLATREGLVDGSGKLHTSGLLRYTVRLISYQEPPEDRMECAHFSPPLSKQRVAFAMNLIHARQAKSLVDLGCGSGSLLEGLMEQPLPLLNILGVDVSSKSLLRAAKSLHSKLARPPHESAVGNLRALTLFEGSIAEFDHRLQHIDIATCIEVVEHLDPEPLAKFGEIVLGRIEPAALLVSTPNIEYNPILQGQTWDGHIDYDEVKLRNDDHRFEWTRSQFRTWAEGLASEYGYEVEYSGVGGSGDEEGPGFASQIAVFTRCRDVSEQVSCTEETVDELPYIEVYSWRHNDGVQHCIP